MVSQKFSSQIAALITTSDPKKHRKIVLYFEKEAGRLNKFNLQDHLGEINLLFKTPDTITDIRRLISLFEDKIVKDIIPSLNLYEKCDWKLFHNIKHYFHKHEQHEQIYGALTKVLTTYQFEIMSILPPKIIKTHICFHLHALAECFHGDKLMKPYFYERQPQIIDIIDNLDLTKFRDQKILDRIEKALKGDDKTETAITRLKSKY